MVAIVTKSGVLSKIEFPSIFVARQWTLYVLCFLSITLLQNKVLNTLSDAIGETKGPFLYCS